MGAAVDSGSSDATLTLLLEQIAALVSNGLPEEQMHVYTQLGLGATFGLAGAKQARSRENAEELG